jgi:hypothetical protein
MIQMSAFGAIIYPALTAVSLELKSTVLGRAEAAELSGKLIAATVAKANKERAQQVKR